MFSRLPYNPMFFAYDWARATSCPSSMKRLRAKASFTVSPLAKPWYAMSKKGNSFLFLIRALISFHCSGWNIKFPNAKLHWTTYFLLLFLCSCIYTKKLNKLFILFFKPLDPLLWDCEHRHARLSHCPQGFSVEKINTDDWEYKYMNKTCSHVDLESWTCFIIFQKEFWKLFIQKFKKKCESYCTMFSFKEYMSSWTLWRHWINKKSQWKY